MELGGIGTTRRQRPVWLITPTALENRVKWSITIDPTVGSRSNFFHEFLEALIVQENRVKRSIIIDPTVGSRSNFFTSFWRLCSMELHGIGTTRQRRQVGAIPPTTQENRVKRSITIDPTVGSRSNFFNEFPHYVFDGVAWNRYNMLTPSGRGHSTDNDREPGQKVHNYRSDRWIALKFLSRVSACCF